MRPPLAFAIGEDREQPWNVARKIHHRLGQCADFGLRLLLAEEIAHFSFLATQMYKILYLHSRRSVVRFTCLELEGSMQECEIRVLSSGHPVIIIDTKYVNDHAAVRSAKILAGNRPFEVWRDLDCIYAPLKEHRSGDRNQPPARS